MNGTFNCNYCSKSFGVENNCKRHEITVHEKMKKYQCEKCEKSYTANTNLKRHMTVVHESGKVNYCAKCDKGLNGNLRDHILTFHDKIKKFKCSFCTQSFPNGSNLKRHILNLHEKLKD